MSRLLLKHDGTLLESFCPLDPPPPYVPPDRWDAPHVQHRFAEAIETLLKLPLGRSYPSEFRNVWPNYTLEFDDLLAQVEVYEHENMRDRHNRVRILPNARAISEMELALTWPGRHLHNKVELARAFNLVGFATARDVNVEDVAGRGRHAGVKSATVWHELAQKAAQAIATGLRVDRVAVF